GTGSGRACARRPPPRNRVRCANCGGSRARRTRQADRRRRRLRMRTAIASIRRACGGAGILSAVPRLEPIAMKGHPEVVDYLNFLLRGELAARDQYFLHSRRYEDFGLHALRSEERRVGKEW